MKAVRSLVVPFLMVVAGCAAPAEDQADDAEQGEAAQVRRPSDGQDATSLVINEMNVLGETEWVEIANKGSRAFDLGGYFLADSDKSTGEPRRDSAMQFPSGTSIAPRGKVLIVLDKEGAAVGPHPAPECLEGRSTSCLFASFAISAERAEAVHILAPDGRVVTSVAYPRTLTEDSEGRTVCRLPDLVGEFTVCTKTPGASNGGG